MKNRWIIQAVAAAGFLVAFWPSLMWYAARLGDGGDERLGLVVLVGALVLGWLGRARVQSSRGGQVAAICLLVVYGLALGNVPSMVVAGIGIAAVVSFWGLWRMPGVVGLLFLSLPVVASLQFYCGYPLRLVTAMGADVLLSGCGVAVDRVGVELATNGTTVGVAPACSGVKMLWAGGVYAGAIAGVLKLRWSKALLVGMAAFGLVLLANVLRAALLVLPEAGVFPVSGTVHEMVGVGCFLGAAIAIGWVANWKPVAVVRRVQG